MKISRSERRAMDQQDARETKAVNRAQKDAERGRRDARMIQKVKTGSLPYTPVVMSWLSDRLSKKASRITDSDVKSLLG